MNLEEFDTVQRWFLKLSLGTQRVYLNHLSEFCKYAGMAPDEIIEERIKDLKSDNEFARRHAEERLNRWFKELEKDKGRNTCVLAYNAVKSFYKHNYYELKTDTPASWPTKVNHPLTRRDLGRLLEATERPMYRAWILCQTQSGLSISDLLAVSYTEVRNQLKSSGNHVHLRLLRGKRKEQGWFDTFFGRMAVQAVKYYLVTEKPKPTTLFQCTARWVNDFLAQLSSKADLSWKVSSHNLRKYFNTQLKLAGVNDTLVEYWMGHSLGKVKGAYLVPPVEEQLRLYKEAEKNLEPTFDGE